MSLDPPLAWLNIVNGNTIRIPFDSLDSVLEAGEVYGIKKDDPMDVEITGGGDIIMRAGIPKWARKRGFK